MGVHEYPSVGWTEWPFRNRIALYCSKQIVFPSLVLQFENDERGIGIEQAGCPRLKFYRCLRSSNVYALLPLRENSVSCAQGT